MPWKIAINIYNPSRYLKVKMNLVYSKIFLFSTSLGRRAMVSSRLLTTKGSALNAFAQTSSIWFHHAHPTLNKDMFIERSLMNKNTFTLWHKVDVTHCLLVLACYGIIDGLVIEDLHLYLCCIYVELEIRHNVCNVYDCIKMCLISSSDIEKSSMQKKQWWEQGHQ